MKPIPISFHVGPLVVHTYGLGLALTFWFAYKYFASRLRKAGLPTDWLTGTFVWIVVSAIVGARLVHVAANWSFYSANPGQILDVWHGGLSSFGGLLFGVPTGLLLARRRCPELETLRALDLVMPVLAASWGVGRLLGPQVMINGGGSPTHAWYGMYYALDPNTYWVTTHRICGLPTCYVKEVPVPVIQAIDSFVIFAILLLIEQHYARRPRAFVLSAGAALWGLGRFFEERFFLASSSVQSGNSNSGVDAVEVAGLALFAAGVVVLIAAALRQRSRHSLAPAGDSVPTDVVHPADHPADHPAPTTGSKDPAALETPTT